MFESKITKKDLEELSATFLGALAQQKEEFVKMIQESKKVAEEKDTCFCFIGARNGQLVPQPIAQLISSEMRELMDRYSLVSITALNIKKSVAQQIQKEGQAT